MNNDVFNVLSDPQDNESVEVPIADGFYETGLIVDKFRDGALIITFHDSSGNLVTPTAGHVKAEMATYHNTVNDDTQWLTPSSGDYPILAVDVVAGRALYTPPSFRGPSLKGRIELSGIQGASYCKAFFWRIV